MTDGLRQGLSVAQRAQARLRLGDDWQLVVAGAVLELAVGVWLDQRVAVPFALASRS